MSVFIVWGVGQSWVEAIREADSAYAWPQEALDLYESHPTEAWCVEVEVDDVDVDEFESEVRFDSTVKGYCPVT